MRFLVFDELATTNGLLMRAQPGLGRLSSAALLASSSPVRNVPSTAPSCAARAEGRGVAGIVAHADRSGL